MSARAATLLYRLRKYARRHWIGVSAAAAVLVSLASATAISVRAARISERQRIRAERATNFLEQVLNSPDPGNRETGLGMGANAKVVDALAAAGERIPAAFADDPALQAELHRAIGYTYMDLGLYPRAEREIQAALQGLWALRDNPRMKAMVIGTAGELDFYLGRSRSGEARLREALAVLDASAQTRGEIELHATGFSDLAMLIGDRNRAEARAFLDRAVNLLATHPSANPSRPFQLLVLQNNQAFLDLASGRLEKARSEAQAAVRNLSSMPAPPLQLSYPLVNLGLVERLLGNEPAALAAFQQAFDVAGRTAGPDRPLALPSRIELAYQQAVAGQTAGEEKELTRCLELARQDPGGANLPRALHALGYVHTLAGHPQLGEPLLREALRLWRKVPSSDYRVALANLELGNCLQRQRRIAEARDCYRAAADGYRQSLGPDSWAARHAAARLAALESR